MPKKNTLKSRKNKRQFSLKKATRKRGGGILSSVSNVFSRSSKPKQEPKRDDLIPPVPELKTFNDLQELFHGIIPLDIFTIDMDKIQEYKRMEENHLKNIERQEEMHRMAEKTMKDIKKRQDEDMYMFRDAMHEADDAAKAAAQNSQKWEPISQPPPLPPRSNKEEPGTD